MNSVFISSFFFLLFGYDFVQWIQFVNAFLLIS